MSFIQNNSQMPPTRKMDGRPTCIINVEDTEPDSYERGPSGIAGISRNIGLAIGTDLIGIDVTEIPPGKKSSYIHHHKHKEEFFYVLSGRCKIRIGDSAYGLRPGDAISRPAGTGIPHQFFNPFSEPCQVLMLGVMEEGKGLEDIVEWPELKRRLLIDKHGNRRMEKI